MSHYIYASYDFAYIEQGVSDHIVLKTVKYIYNIPTDKSTVRHSE